MRAKKLGLISELDFFGTIALIVSFLFLIGLNFPIGIRQEVYKPEYKFDLSIGGIDFYINKGKYYKMHNRRFFCAISPTPRESVKGV